MGPRHSLSTANGSCLMSKEGRRWVSVTLRWQVDGPSEVWMGMRTQARTQTETRLLHTLASGSCLPREKQTRSLAVGGEVTSTLQTPVDRQGQSSPVSPPFTDTRVFSSRRARGKSSSLTLTRLDKLYPQVFLNLPAQGLALGKSTQGA